ncbi:MAG: GntR family transcriptional regulator [Pseudomonadota bacterium]
MAAETGDFRADLLFKRTQDYKRLEARSVSRNSDGVPVTQQLKKSDDLAQKLSARIVRGQFQPGEKLRQDLIAREFGVSQVTVREALLGLASKGLAVSVPRRGICVAPMDQGAVEELRTMRCALEPVALYRSVPNLTPDQIAQIGHIHMACNAAETSEEWEEANRDFHMAVISACKMPRLIAEISNLQLLYAWHFNARHTARWRRRDDPDHAAILAAIKNRDAERARSIMQRHLMRLP